MTYWRLVAASRLPWKGYVKRDREVESWPGRGSAHTGSRLEQGVEWADGGSGPKLSILEPVRRILQLGALILVLTTFLTPVSEAFDRWDAPGMVNDVEMPLFAMVLTLALVLIVASLVSSTLQLLMVLLQAAGLAPAAVEGRISAAWFAAPAALLSRGSPPPLRI